MDIVSTIKANNIPVSIGAGIISTINSNNNKLVNGLIVGFIVYGITMILPEEANNIDYNQQSVGYQPLIPMPDMAKPVNTTLELWKGVSNVVGVNNGKLIFDPTKTFNRHESGRTSFGSY